jgi:hypothetical protein
VRQQILWRIAVRANDFAAPFLKLLYVVVILRALLAPWLILRARARADVKHVLVSALAAGTLAVFVVACVSACYNNQYGTPFLPVIVICFVVTLSEARTVTRKIARAERHNWRRRRQQGADDRPD